MKDDEPVYIRRTDGALLIHDPETGRLLQVIRPHTPKATMNKDDLATVRAINHRLDEMHREDEPRKAAGIVALIIAIVCVLTAIALRAAI